MAALTAIQQIRLLVGDKDAANDGTGDVFGLTDDEITWAYNQTATDYGTADVFLAAADLLDSIASKVAQTAKSITVGAFSKNTGSQADDLSRRSAILRKRALEVPAGGAAEIAWTDQIEEQIIANKWERES